MSKPWRTRPYEKRTRKKTRALEHLSVAAAAIATSRTRIKHHLAFDTFAPRLLYKKPYTYEDAGEPVQQWSEVDYGWLISLFRHMGSGKLYHRQLSHGGKPTNIMRVKNDFKVIHFERCDSGDMHIGTFTSYYYGILQHLPRDVAYDCMNAMQADAESVEWVRAEEGKRCVLTPPAWKLLSAPNSAGVYAADLVDHDSKQDAVPGVRKEWQCGATIREQVAAHKRFAAFAPEIYYATDRYYVMAYAGEPSISNMRTERFHSWLLELFKYMKHIGFYHRDIHDGNVVWLDGVPRLIDFELCGDRFWFFNFTRCNPYLPGHVLYAIAEIVGCVDEAVLLGYSAS